MQKSDLKTGMLVQIRNGNVYVVLKNYLDKGEDRMVRDGGRLKLSNYSENLKNKYDSEFDIMMVYEPISPSISINFGRDELIYERPNHTQKISELKHEISSIEAELDKKKEELEKLEAESDK